MRLKKMKKKKALLLACRIQCSENEHSPYYREYVLVIPYMQTNRITLNVKLIQLTKKSPKVSSKKSILADVVEHQHDDVYCIDLHITQPPYVYSYYCGIDANTFEWKCSDCGFVNAYEYIKCAACDGKPERSSDHEMGYTTIPDFKNEINNSWKRDSRMKEKIRYKSSGLMSYGFDEKSLEIRCHTNVGGLIINTIDHGDRFDNTLMPEYKIFLANLGISNVIRLYFKNDNSNRLRASASIGKRIYQQLRTSCAKHKMNAHIAGQSPVEIEPLDMEVAVERRIGTTCYQQNFDKMEQLRHNASNEGYFLWFCLLTKFTVTKESFDSLFTLFISPPQGRGESDMSIYGRKTNHIWGKARHKLAVLIAYMHICLYIYYLFFLQNFSAPWVWEECTYDFSRQLHLNTTLDESSGEYEFLDIVFMAHVLLGLKTPSKDEIQKIVANATDEEKFESRLSLPLIGIHVTPLRIVFDTFDQRLRGLSSYICAQTCIANPLGETVNGPFYARFCLENVSTTVSLNDNGALTWNEVLFNQYIFSRHKNIWICGIAINMSLSVGRRQRALNLSTNDIQLLNHATVRQQLFKNNATKDNSTSEEEENKMALDPMENGQLLCWMFALVHKGSGSHDR
ncbi:hypothetical protein RFI_13952 [Reticulomyxa filosa]|uniref:RanBP2-type domain-containing protein n=1 Tax=Reticulomyxa filosa TaxID=46433 RepID=X6NBR9_RETFI|nr:hypothetical protein RFI_13952 [Reticulomyxa filosa]|eukprot:ETO23229.1 hypothetical protein RFI_13952 [Reticulomyxa filosa]